SLGDAARWLLTRDAPWRSFDINVRLKLAPPERWAACLAEAMPLASTVFATEHELAAIGCPVANIRGVARDCGTTLVVRGDRTPTRIYRPDDVVEEVHPIYLDSPVDPVGAGDAFAAAVTACRLRGDGWRDAVRAGHWAGAMVARARGDYEAAPYRAELEALMAREVVVR
ncbi:MAG: carbohydrate kinase family protein, partial [Firmicutes bacterium]|nr:carbohydrate kinase family protein [Bacillota bacterium]